MPSTFSTSGPNSRSYHPGYFEPTSASLEVTNQFNSFDSTTDGFKKTPANCSLGDVRAAPYRTIPTQSAIPEPRQNFAHAYISCQHGHASQNPIGNKQLVELVGSMNMDSFGPDIDRFLDSAVKGHLDSVVAEHAIFHKSSYVHPTRTGGEIEDRKNQHITHCQLALSQGELDRCIANWNQLPKLGKLNYQPLGRFRMHYNVYGHLEFDHDKSNLWESGTSNFSVFLKPDQRSTAVEGAQGDMDTKDRNANEPILVNDDERTKTSNKELTSRKDRALDTGLVRYEKYNPIVDPILSTKNPKLQEFAKKFGAFRENSSNYQDKSLVITSNTYKRHFFPSRMALESKGFYFSDARNQLKDNYLGYGYSALFKDHVPNLEDLYNCSLWITGMHPSAVVGDLLRAVRTGPVRFAHINEAADGYLTTAATLCFTKPSAAADFIAEVESFAGIRVLGHQLEQVCYNRNGYTEYRDSKKSRVLQVEGPIELMTSAFWIQYFEECVCFQLEDDPIFEPIENGQAAMQFRFARVEGQADACYFAIKAEAKFYGLIQVKYITDPCDPNPGVC
ncbi:hypothetical protein B7494_g1683 [Chlorociboria aeruginascens]|nr:hypothetical protein B7494_g1683 [Chlorociboria aeruginascens]